MFFKFYEPEKKPRWVTKTMWRHGLCILIEQNDLLDKITVYWQSKVWPEKGEHEISKKNILKMPQGNMIEISDKTFHKMLGF